MLDMLVCGDHDRPPLPRRWMPRVRRMHPNEADCRRHEDRDAARPQIALDYCSVRGKRGLPHIARKIDPSLPISCVRLATTLFGRRIGRLGAAVRLRVEKAAPAQLGKHFARIAAGPAFDNQPTLAFTQR